MSTSALSEALPSSTPTRLLIGGEWIQTAAGLNVINPASYGTLATIGDAGVTEGIQAVDAAHDAFQTWSLTPARVRAEILRKAFDIMVSEIDDCARLIALENVKLGAMQWVRRSTLQSFSAGSPRKHLELKVTFVMPPIVTRRSSQITGQWALLTWSRLGISPLQ